MLRLLKRKYGKKEVSSSFLENGSNLLEGFASASNCTYNTPFRNFKAKEIISATSNFREGVMCDGTGTMFRGYFRHRQILVKRYDDRGATSNFREGVMCDGTGTMFRDYFRRPQILVNLYDDRDLNRELLSYINRDIVISLMMSQHKNVLRFLGCCLDFKAPVLVYEYLGQDRLLDDILFRRKDETLTWKNRLKIASDVANAIVYLHTAFSTPVIHRDLSTRNIVIDEFGVAKLLDFSLCISLPPGESRVQDDIIIGATGYFEPEYRMTAIVTEKTDVYMFGVILLILLTGKSFLSHQNDEGFILVDSVQDHIKNNRLDKILDNVNVGERGEMEEQLQDVAELALRCTKPKGEDRPNMIDVAKELRNIERSSRHC